MTSANHRQIIGKSTVHDPTQHHRRLHPIKTSSRLKRARMKCGYDVDRFHHKLVGLDVCAEFDGLAQFQNLGNYSGTVIMRP